MKTFPVKFIVRRWSNAEMTYAVVKADVMAEKQPGERVFLALLTKALTEWKSSSKNFNVGDLSNCLPSAVLEKILVKHGIHGLTVKINSKDEECQEWSYDTVLIDGE